MLHRQGLVHSDGFLALARDKAFLKELGIQARSIEGYLFPDTYFIRPSEKSNPKMIMTAMV
ncbi:aminodeoxychorismate lyase, partial [Thermodesulfobacteriota bacterium]